MRVRVRLRRRSIGVASLAEGQARPGRGYDWIECGACGAGWQVPHSRRGLLQLLDADETMVLFDFRDAWERRSGGMDGLLGLAATA
jgi:hypothetical protein